MSRVFVSILPERLHMVVCDDAVHFLQLCGPETYDFTLFSPPYDGIRDYTKDERGFDLLALGRELYRVTKEGGICAVVMNDGTKDFAKSLSTFGLAVDWNREIGWRLFEAVVYARDGKPGAWWAKRFRVDHEYILLFLKGARPKTFNKEPLKVPAKHAGKTWAGTQRLTSGEMVPIKRTEQAATKCRGTIWRYSTSNSEGNKVKTRHPATFPDALARDLILCFTEPGDLVLDPMAGSGTTLVVAEQLGRLATGIDISIEYCNIAIERLKNEGQNVAV